MRLLLVLLVSAILFYSAGVLAGTRHTIPLLESAGKTLYVEGAVGPLKSSKFMLDTGSGYTTINQETFESLKKTSRIQFVKKILGVLADGSQRSVDIWQVESVTLNGHCTLKNVEVAVMPGTRRQILGLTTLRKAAPFTVSLNPPSLSLSNCI